MSPPLYTGRTLGCAHPYFNEANLDLPTPARPIKPTVNVQIMPSRATGIAAFKRTVRRYLWSWAALALISSYLTPARSRGFEAALAVSRPGFPPNLARLLA